MRSRYSAFALGDDAYLRFSWHPATLPSGQLSSSGTTWTGLEILAAPEVAHGARRGYVEFVAHYRDRDGDAAMRERSKFVVHDGRWVYLEGVHE